MRVGVIPVWSEISIVQPTHGCIGTNMFAVTLLEKNVIRLVVIISSVFAVCFAFLICLSSFGQYLDARVDKDLYYQSELGSAYCSSGVVW